jgi:carboxymethylenebutenolidase
MPTAIDRAAEAREVPDIAIPLPDGGNLRAAIARPDDPATGPGINPGLVVLHESFGLNSDIRRIAARLALSGYVALAPDLYSHGNRLNCLSRVMLEALTGADHGVMGDIEATRAHLAGLDGVDSDRVGVIGFCQGGGFALAFAAKGAVAAAAVNYGRVLGTRDNFAAVCPVVASYGGRDQMLREDPARLERYLDSLGVPHDVKVYPGAGHSFLSYDNGPAWLMRLPSPMHVGYDEVAAEDAWSRILAFFEKHL